MGTPRQRVIRPHHDWTCWVEVRRFGQFAPCLKKPLTGQLTCRWHNQFEPEARSLQTGLEKVKAEMKKDRAKALDRALELSEKVYRKNRRYAMEAANRDDFEDERKYCARADGAKEVMGLLQDLAAGRLAP